MREDAVTVRVALLIAIASVLLPGSANAQAKPESIPKFEPQPYWPKPLPETWSSVWA